MNISTEPNYNSTFHPALYVRLSREDENKQNINDCSESIKNQKEFLKEFAIKNGYSIVDIYADDGISGTTFDRSEFNRMIADIEKRKNKYGNYKRSIKAWKRLY